jgi:predicted permease
MIKKYFKTAWRSLLHQKKMSVINIAGLSIGMTAAILILQWVQNELTYDNFHPDANRIYRITNHLEVTSGDTWIWENSPLVYASAAMHEIPEIETAATFMNSWSGMNVTMNNELLPEKKCAFADSNWFRMFHFDVAYGSLEAFSANPYSLALTKSKAEKYFGKGNAIGQVVRVDSINYVVRAVLEENPTNSSFQYDIWLPLSAYLANTQNAKNSAGWNNFNFITFLKLRPDADKATVEKKLTALILRNKEKSKFQTKLTKLPDIHFETNLQSSIFRHTDKKTVVIFSVLAFLLLLTACINYVNLTTARASLRSKEVSIRKIVGAERGQLFGQFMAESFLISFISLAITLFLVWISLPFFNHLTENHFTISLQNTGIWKVLLGTLLITTILNGIYPALLLSSFKPLQVLRGSSVLKIRDGYLRKALVVIQFGISMMLITGTIVIFEQMRFIQKSNSSYDKSQILNISVPWRALRDKKADDQGASYMEGLKKDILDQNMIQSVSLAQNGIVDNTSFSSGGFDWHGREKDFNPAMVKLSTDADFHSMFHLSLLDGRWYRDHDKADEHGFIINETAVKDLGIRKPVVGQWFVLSGDTGTIIGVVKDFPYKSMHEKIGPVIMYNEPGYRTSLFIQIKAGQAGKAVAAIKNIWKQRFPSFPYEYKFLDETFDQLYKNDTRISQLILIFSLIAIFISALGLFGLAAFTAEKRTKEIGIRKVLGASVQQIVTVLSKEFIFLVLISILAATPIAWYFMNKWLDNFAYRIGLSIWIFAAAGILSLLIALITVSIQAIKAAMANPADSLRTE